MYVNYCLNVHVALKSSSYRIIFSLLYKLKEMSKVSHGLALGMKLRKEAISNQKQSSCKKRERSPKNHGEKRYEIKGGGQEMAVMVG